MGSRGGLCEERPGLSSAGHSQHHVALTAPPHGAAEPVSDTGGASTKQIRAKSCPGEKVGCRRAGKEEVKSSLGKEGDVVEGVVSVCLCFTLSKSLLISN